MIGYPHPLPTTVYNFGRTETELALYYDFPTMLGFVVILLGTCVAFAEDWLLYQIRIFRLARGRR